MPAVMQATVGACANTLGSALPRAHDQSGGPGWPCQFASRTKCEHRVRFDVGEDVMRNPIEQEKIRQESTKVLRLVTRNPKRLASARRVSTRMAQMQFAGERANPIEEAGVFLRGVAREGGRWARALVWWESMAMEGEMDVRDVAPEADYPVALQELHDQITKALPRLLAELCGKMDPDEIEDLALDVGEAAKLLAVRARQLKATQRKGRAA